MNNNQDLTQNTLKSSETQTYTIAQGTIAEEATPSYDGLFEVLLMGVVSIVGFYTLYKKSSLYLDRPSRPRAGILKRFSRPSCASCRFLDRSSSLKCQLHSIRVNSKEETDCTDYWHKDRHRFFHH